MFILKLAVAAFLVSLNIFSFLLIKFQKNDREKKLLKGIADGESDIKTTEEKTAKPDEEEKEKAQQALQSMEKKPDSTEKLQIMSDEDELPKDDSQKKEEKKKLLEKFYKKPVSDLKILLCAVLGGSLGIYISLFIFRYRLRDILMMVLVPTLLVLNIYIYLQLFTVWLITPAGVKAFINITAILR